MGYDGFTIGLALEKLHIKEIESTEEPELYKNLSQELFEKKEFLPSPAFQEDFNFGLEMYRIAADHSEEMRNNHLIRPFLWEVWKHHRRLFIWQEMKLNADAKLDLVGKPDYFVTQKSRSPKAPYCIIIEAKKNDFEKGWGQALAAMKGAQIINKRMAALEMAIYGIVSTGREWQFGKLLGNQFVISSEMLFINIIDPATSEKVLRILAVLDVIFSECERMLDQETSDKAIPN